MTHQSHKKVRKREIELIPKLSVVECKGVWANISELTQKNIEETLSFFVKPEDLTDKNPDDVTAHYSCGGDASGNNPVYQSKNQHGSPNIILYGMRLEKIVTREKELYVEKSLGPNTEIPIGLIPSKESNDEVFVACLRRLEDQIHEAEVSTHQVIVNGKVYKCQAKFELSQMDSSFASKATGTGGAFCQCCSVTKDEAMNPEVVRHGFCMTRTLAATRAHYAKLLAAGRIDPNGGRHKANSQERMGITRAPILLYKDIMWHIYPLHCLLHGLDWFEDYLVTFNSRAEWPNSIPYRRAGKELTVGQKKALKDKRTDMRERARDPNGLAQKLDMADRTGAGGNTDNGPVARYFFEEKSRPHVVNLFDYDEGDIETPLVIADLHQRFSVILRIINCTLTIKVAEFRQFCIDTNLLMVEEPNIKWMAPSNTIHRFIAHAWQSILLNGCEGLGQKAEGALEGAHQNVKFSQAHLTSKQDVTQMFRDMFASLYFVQAPSVCRFEPTKRQYSRKAKLEEFSRDNELFSSFIVGPNDEDYVQQLQF